MTIILCVSNYFYERTYYIVNESDAENLLARPLKQDIPRKALKTGASGTDVYYLMQELLNYTAYRRKLCQSPQLSGKLMVIQIVPPLKEAIDYKWNRITSRTIWEKIEVDYLMSWLSTLGGGFSALGEQFSKCAVTAGKISLRQLQLGLRLGDPFLQARCKLYYSISLIQTGRLRTAKHIIRQQYDFAITQKDIDNRLVKMCIGIWQRLQYEYSQRRERKQSALKLPPQTPKAIK